MSIERIVMYKSKDGILHETEEKAIYHEEFSEQVEDVYQFIQKLRTSYHDVEEIAKEFVKHYKMEKRECPLT
jgi:hypothetical protein